MTAWGRLLRLSLLPSAAADVAAGLVLGFAGDWPGGSAPWLLILSSVFVYHGSLALNDWADRVHDARTRPDRPIPAGHVTPAAALTTGVALQAIGVAWAWLASPVTGLWMAGIALAALFYDVKGRGPILGPGLLALCRGANLAVGLVYARDVQLPRPLETDPAGLPIGLWTVPVLYGLYVFAVSRMGRLEDGEDSDIGERPRKFLFVAAACLLAVSLVQVEDTLFLDPWRSLSFAVAGFGAFGLLRTALATKHWDRAAVGRAMGSALRRLLAFTAAAALLPLSDGTDGLIVALAILAGYPLAFLLRGLFPPS